MPEPCDEETLRILLNVIRMLESRHGVRFGLDALPAVLEMTRCWQPEAAFPGKAAVWLNRLAVKHRGGEVCRGSVLDEFRAASGLQMAFADTRARLLRDDIVGRLAPGGSSARRRPSRRLVDLVAVGKARLNDRKNRSARCSSSVRAGVSKTEYCQGAHGRAVLFGDAARWSVST